MAKGQPAFFFQQGNLPFLGQQQPGPSMVSVPGTNNSVQSAQSNMFLLGPQLQIVSNVTQSESNSYRANSSVSNQQPTASKNAGGAIH